MLAAPRLTEHAHLTRVRPDDVHQDADERALAGAVRPEQPEDLAGVHVKGDAAKRGCVAVALGDVVERENNHVRKSLPHLAVANPERAMRLTQLVSSPSERPRSMKARLSPSRHSRPVSPNGE